MATFDSRENILSGVPLGGLGTGKLEILPSGVWNAFTFLNNWSAPLSGPASQPGIAGFHSAVSVRLPGRRRQSLLLQTAPMLDLPTVRSIRYDGAFPDARLEYVDRRLPVQVTLKASGSFVPGDADASCVPGARFVFSVRNPLRVPVEVSFMVTARNVMGAWNVGRRNRVRDASNWLHLDLSHEDRRPRDMRSGRLQLSFSKKGWAVSHWECWNAVSENFKLDSSVMRFDVWDEFARTGRLPNRKGSVEASGENREWCSAACATAVVPAGGSREWFWTAAWNVPHAFEPARYQKIYRTPEAAHAYLSTHRRRLERVTTGFHRAVRSLPFPEWFNDALINSLYPFVSSTRYLSDGRFAFFEAPVACPLMGTVDVGFYGSIPLAWFFPEQSKMQLRQFARAQRPDGYVPHDLGRERLDRASDGTTPHFWKDLNPKYVLMVWRDFVWSSDRRFLKDLYPSVRRALEWTAAADINGDGLPDHDGPDQTFDLWDMRGAHAYTASLYAAALLAGRRMAGILGDSRFEGQCGVRFDEVRFALERRLWNGRYFGPTCLLMQLAGQWYAELTGLEDITSPRKIARALETARVWNARPTRWGWVNSTLDGGRLDTANAHTQNVWVGMNAAFASLLVSRGYPLNKVLKPLERLWDNLERRQRHPWNQPDMIDAHDGRFLFGDGYYRSMAIWSIPISFARRDARTARILERMRHALRSVRA